MNDHLIRARYILKLMDVLDHEQMQRLEDQAKSLIETDPAEQKPGFPERWPTPDESAAIVARCQQHDPWWLGCLEDGTRERLKTYRS